jgi:glycosyltransferase involved in cell wall biosynthesis
MRTTHGPLKSNVPAPRPPFISACVVTHYRDTTPQEKQYHKDRMEVVRTCLSSMLAGMQGADYELLIWDNDSAPEFRAMLRSFSPAMLIESVNIGAHNARHNLAEIARGEILMQTDDDILFHPDWLSLQLEVLSVYPNVGVVSGSPYRWAFKWGQTSAQIPAGAKVTKAPGLLPEQWVKDACASVGQNYISASWGMRDIEDVLLEYKGVKAWGHAHHMQFIGKTATVKPFLKPNKYLLGNGRDFNNDIMQAGLLQLTTHHRTAIHIGNFIDARLREIMKDWGV